LNPFSFTFFLVKVLGLALGLDAFAFFLVLFLGALLADASATLDSPALLGLLVLVLFLCPVSAFVVLPRGVGPVGPVALVAVGLGPAALGGGPVAAVAVGLGPVGPVAAVVEVGPVGLGPVGPVGLGPVGPVEVGLGAVGLATIGLGLGPVGPVAPGAEVVTLVVVALGTVTVPEAELLADPVAEPEAEPLAGFALTDKGAPP
jgi:hypothetical protein